MPALLSIGASTAARATPFRVTFERLGGGSRSLCWLAPEVVPDALIELHRSLTEALGREQFATEERTFRPHVTLARNGTTPARRGSVAPIAWEVDEMTLVASTTAPGGSRYARIGRWALGRR